MLQRERNFGLFHHRHLDVILRRFPCEKLERDDQMQQIQHRLSLRIDVDDQTSTNHYNEHMGLVFYLRCIRRQNNGASGVTKFKSYHLLFGSSLDR